MNPKNTTSLLQSISDILHPLLMLTYATSLACRYSLLTMLPMQMKSFLMGEVFFFTCLFPSLCIFVLYKMKIVSHLALRERKDRAIPLGINAFSYAYCTYLLYDQGMPMYLVASFVGATIVAFVCWIVSFWWKISAHLSGIMAFTATSFVLYLHPMTLVPLWAPLLLTVLSGLLASIRVYLGRHTMMQVGVGALVGAVVILLSYWLLD